MDTLPLDQTEKLEPIRPPVQPIKPLPVSFKREGFNYQQIWRRKDIAVYQYGPRGRFELVIIRIQRQHTARSGSVVPRREAYPCNTEWGQYGWTLGPKDRELAIHIAEQIVDLPSDKRIPKIHAIMDRWKETRAALQTVVPEPQKLSPDALEAGSATLPISTLPQEGEKPQS
jgi:hypothetical protein